MGYTRRLEARVAELEGALLEHATHGPPQATEIRFLKARVTALESAPRLLYEACDSWAGEDGMPPQVPRRVLTAIAAARGLLDEGTDNG
jgi:hypothetical protein